MSADISAAVPSADQVLAQVEKQRARLMDVLGVMQCVGICVSDNSPRTPTELEGAVALAERELYNVIEALEGPELKRAIAASEKEEAQP